MKNNNSLINEEIYKKGLESINNKNFKLAEDIFSEILEKFPDHINSLFLLGYSLYAQKKNYTSLQYLIKATSLKKNFRDADYFIGKNFQDLKQFKKAKKYFQKIFNEYPKDLQNFINLITVLIDLKEFKISDILLKKNKKIFKNDGVFENLYGYLNLHSAKNNLSIQFYLESFKKNSKNLNTIINLAYVYLRSSDFINSKKYFMKALELNPESPNTLYAYSYFQLISGYIKEGLINYENRKFVYNYNMNLFNNYNEWKGQNLDGKTLLILSEQGLGDTIQFSRYIFDIKKKYKVKIIFQTKKKLFHFFNNKDLDLHEGKGKLPFFNYFVFLLSLPGILYFKEKIFLENYNYIPINKLNFQKWKNKLDYLKGKKIGLNWQGDPNFTRDFMRSVKLEIFEDLFKNKNCNFISLQHGTGIDQINQFKYKNKLINFSDKVDKGINSFEDTISILKNLDLVITTDTAIAHLAGTMELETWLVLHFNPEWRWQIQNKNFRWYPRLKIFKQKIKDDWKNVIADINEHLNHKKI